MFVLRFANSVVSGVRFRSYSATRKIRPARRRRARFRTPIPFLDQLKICRNPDDYLSLLRDFSEQGYKHHYPCYASLVYRLARAGRFDDVELVLDYLKSRDVRCREALFIGLIRRYGKAGLIERAVEVFREMGRLINSPRTVLSFNTVLNVLVDGGRMPEAVELFRGGSRMGFRLNEVSYNVMMKMLLAEDDWEDAVKLFDEMLDRRIQPTVVTYNSLIGFLCRRGEVDAAKKLFESMRRKGKRGNAVTYALLMEGLCASGNSKEARKLMFDMEYHGCKTELVNYGVLLTDLANRGLVDEAKALLGDMKRRRIKPDVVMYNILIHHLCRNGEASGGYKMLVDMQVIDGCEPNAATFRAVADGLCGEGDYVGALKVVTVMMSIRRFPRVETLRRLVTGLLVKEKNRVEEAGFVLEEMKKLKMNLDWDCWEAMVTEVVVVHGSKPEIDLDEINA